MRTFIYGRLRLVLPVLALFVMTSLAAAQATGADSAAATRWKSELESSLGVTQSSYSNNWAGSEAGSIIWVADLRTALTRWWAYRWLFANELKLAFGQSHSQDEITNDWTSPQKSADRIRFDSILRLTRGWPVDPYAAGSLESQFYDATGLEERYLNPLELTETAGVARYIMNEPDVRIVTTRVGFGFRQRFHTIDDTLNVGQTLDADQTDGGVEWVTDIGLGSPKTRVSFVSKVTVFQALFNSEADNLNDDWKTADLNWDNTLRANVNKILQVSLGWQLLYDKQVDLGGRFKETLTLGLSYKFSNS